MWYVTRHEITPSDMGKFLFVLFYLADTCGAVIGHQASLLEKYYFGGSFSIFMLLI